MWSIYDVVTVPRHRHTITSTSTIHTYSFSFLCGCSKHKAHDAMHIAHTAFIMASLYVYVYVSASQCAVAKMPNANHNSRLVENFHIMNLLKYMFTFSIEPITRTSPACHSC